ncbi:MAG TPA: hypothetical protein PLR65_11905 [Anaerolineales bacterium]|mgnify:CR=1 FL=1|nr:hypothetical protein [Anaerolineales bacterium]
MITQHISILRAGALILFVVALLGPWTFDVINVPAEYECSEPFIRLSGDFCGMPMSGFQFLWLWIVIGLSIPFLLPFFTTLLLLWKKDARRLRTIHLIAWALALILALVIFIGQTNDPIIRLWGLWLYILLAVGAILIEYLASKNNPASNI